MNEKGKFNRHDETMYVPAMQRDNFTPVMAMNKEFKSYLNTICNKLDILSSMNEKIDTLQRSVEELRKEVSDYGQMNSKIQEEIKSISDFSNSLKQQYSQTSTPLAPDTDGFRQFLEGMGFAPGVASNEQEIRKFYYHSLLDGKHEEYIEEIQNDKINEDATNEVEQNIGGEADSPELIDLQKEIREESRQKAEQEKQNQQNQEENEQDGNEQEEDDDHEALEKAQALFNSYFDKLKTSADGMKKIDEDLDKQMQDLIMSQQPEETTEIMTIHQVDENMMQDLIRQTGEITKNEEPNQNAEQGRELNEQGRELNEQGRELNEQSKEEKNKTDNKDSVDEDKESTGKESKTSGSSFVVVETRDELLKKIAQEEKQLSKFKSQKKKKEIRENIENYKKMLAELPGDN